MLAKIVQEYHRMGKLAQRDVMPLESKIRLTSNILAIDFAGVSVRTSKENKNEIHYHYNIILTQVG